ncbi:hypothetical protein FOMPIDRAFT_1034132 [Fomitopsis schrenkii]|uniref:RRM domain-containing protein n=1 Tax=Fomitopsis schrenkii TaxID=2126942 RepID=S8FYQ9_FOMSC|nr:hypothetical protein FOMPIDRAFT_1034132 [Fomitopsis schrenkii]
MASGIQKHVNGFANKLLRRQGNSPLNGTFILAHNVPRSAIPADIKRVCAKYKVEHVSDVSLDYYRFQPTGRAWLTLSSPNYMQHALKAMQGTVLSGKALRGVPVNDPSEAITRTRGVKGRLEAAERGLFTGNGPNGMSTGQGKGVVIYGLPGKLTPGGLRTYLRNFKLASAEAGQQEIVKLETPNKRLTLKSRYYVRLSSVAEAHRLVRELHMTFFERNIYENKYPIRAQVVY